MGLRLGLAPGGSPTRRAGPGRGAARRTVGGGGPGLHRGWGPGVGSGGRAGEGGLGPGPGGGVEQLPLFEDELEERDAQPRDGGLGFEVVERGPTSAERAAAAGVLRGAPGRPGFRARPAVRRARARAPRPGRAPTRGPRCLRGGLVTRSGGTAGGAGTTGLLPLDPGARAGPSASLRADRTRRRAPDGPEHQVLGPEVAPADPFAKPPPNRVQGPEPPLKKEEGLSLAARVSTLPRRDKAFGSVETDLVEGPGRRGVKGVDVVTSSLTVQI